MFINCDVAVNIDVHLAAKNVILENFQTKMRFNVGSSNFSRHLFSDD